MVFVRPQPGRGRRAGAALLALTALAGSAALLPAPARAFDVFGLFGSGESGPPAPTPSTVTYVISFEGVEDDGDLLQALKDASTLYRLRQEALPDGDSLVRRAEADLPRLTDALWGAGYYDGRVSIQVDGIPVGEMGRGRAAGRRTEAYRNRAPVPVRIAVARGPLFTLRTVAVRDARTGSAFDPGELPPRIAGLKEGEPARSATVLAAEARIVDHLRAQGHPFAKMVSRDPVVDHRAKVMDVSFTVDPGPRAGIGPVTVRGAETVDPAVVRSFIYAEPGDPYSPKALADIRKSVSRIEALSSVRVREADALDRQGNLPLFVDVTERPPRLVGFSARYSTVDGPGVKAYWAHRNLFGGAETLRLDADLFFTDRGDSQGATFDRRKGLDWSDLGGRLAASFVKPALAGTRNDLLANASVVREATRGYTSEAGGGTAAIRHRFSDTFSAQVGIEAQTGQATDVLGRVDYTLVGLPAAVIYDSTDSPLDPTRGVRLNASVTPYPTFLGSDPGLFIAKGQASTYYALDDENRYVLAGRLGFGSISGAALEDVPANLRFFAGGGGSVRGFAYRTLGPRGPLDKPIGGLSLLEGSIEARIKITDTIGIVPFLDAGTAFRSSVPDFDERIRVSAGLGLRYYTGIGPIRLDVAVPLDRRKGESAAAVYISLGQAF
jgi:translocation and assembly module TamA